MMRLICISDTHGRHRELSLPNGDLLIHAGDILSHGNDRDQLADFDAWLGEQPHRHKIVVPGNHDKVFVSEGLPEQVSLANAILLIDAATEVDGLRIYGAPWSLEYGPVRWPFTGNDSELEVVYRGIPDDAEVVITHGPAYEYLDRAPVRTERGILYEHAGSWALRSRLKAAKPVLHVCGHIHESYGYWNSGPTWHINAALLDGRYRLVNPPVVVDLNDSTVSLP